MNDESRSTADQADRRATPARRSQEIGSDPGRRTPALWLTLLSAALGAGVLVLDLETPLGIPTGALYALVVLVGLWSTQRAFPVVVAAASTPLVIGGLFFSPGGDFGLAVINRALSLVMIWVTAVLVCRYGAVADALESRSRRTLEYLDIAEVMLVAIDADERVSLMSRRGCELFGRPEAEIIGRNWFDEFVPQHHREPTRAVFRQLMDNRVSPPSSTRTRC